MLLAHRPTHDFVKLRAELFRVELLVDLCIAGLATANPEQMHAGGRTMEVVRMKITEAGRQVLTGKDSP